MHHYDHFLASKRPILVASRSTNFELHRNIVGYHSKPAIPTILSTRKQEHHLTLISVHRTWAPGPDYHPQELILSSNSSTLGQEQEQLLSPKVPSSTSLKPPRGAAATFLTRDIRHSQPVHYTDSHDLPIPNNSQSTRSAFDFLSPAHSS